VLQVTLNAIAQEKCFYYTVMSALNSTAI